MSHDVVHIDRRDGVAVITLHRPEARNAMNVALAAATVEAIASCQDDGAIVLTGADPAFCAGLDLRDLGVDGLGDLPRFVDAAARSDAPIVAAVNGPAVTGGLELALACDFIVASERAAFADTHLRVGVYPGPVAVDLPRRVGMAMAREMTLTGNFVDAATALRIGLVNHVVAHDQVVDVAVALAAAISENPRSMVRELRRDWDETGTLDLEEAYAAHYAHAAAAGGVGTGAAIADRRDDVLTRSRDQRRPTT